MQKTCKNASDWEEKVSCEIRESPSMCRRSSSIVQATAGSARSAALLLGLALLFGAWERGACADLVIEIPGAGDAGDAGAEDAGGRYRLDYRPPQGSPAPNYTVPARASTINFQGLPGTKYHFMLYYSNATFADLLTWNQTIVTAPEPPGNLTVTPGRGKQATVAWSPPARGQYTGFRFRVLPLTERAEGARNATVEGAGNWTLVLRDLSPGASYQLHASTLLHDTESAAYASTNFTTKPNTPGKFIVWFRNETTLLVLWQPPYPAGFYTQYKVSIVPGDARDSELYVEKEGEPPGPAQAAFKGLVPGRAYNISVHTVSEHETSAPTTAQYRTVPLRPRNLTVDARTRTHDSFRLAWLPPLERSEFEKYQVSLSAAAGARRPQPVLRARNETPECTFEGLEPGATYGVSVKTMSGKVTSWPATVDVTLKPLPVVGLRWRYSEEGGAVAVWWSAAPDSAQDEFRVSYHEAGPTRDDSSALTTRAPNATLEALLPGRNYTVAVTAVSRGLDSNETVFAVATRPLAPVVRSAVALPLPLPPTVPGSAALRLAWSSDVNSRQDSYRLRYRRAGHADADADHEQTYRTVETRDTNATLEGLFPGAVYEIQVAAVSHGLLGDWHTVHKPVRPPPPTDLEVERLTSNSAAVRWRAPAPAAGVVGQFAVRHRVLGAARWSRPPPLPPTATRAEIADMTHGERYEILVESLSEAAPGDERAESGRPPSVEHTVRPNPVSDVARLPDTRNVTLEWPRPKGRVETYSLRWWPSDEGDEGEAAARELTVPAGPAGPARAVLDRLRPGAGYEVAMAAHSYGLAGDLFTMHVRTRPLIKSEMTIVSEPDDSDDEDTLPSFLVIYTRTPASESRFDSYRFRLEGAGGGEGEEGSTVTRAADAGPQQLRFSRLTPGRLYSVTMWCVSRNVTSHPVQRAARLPPRPVLRLNATRLEARAVELRWQPPPGDRTDFLVQYLRAPDRLVALPTADAHVRIDGLRPHTLYTFTVEVRSGTATTLMTRSAARSVAASTLAAPPGAPRDFHPRDATPSAVTLQWELPESERNGRLTRFVLEYGADGADEADEPPRRLALPPDASSCTVTGLSPGATYRFRLRAETAAGAGPAARWTQRMAIAAPPRPPPSALPTPAGRTTTTAAVRFRADYFSPANGNVTAYTLVVAETARNDSPARLPSWRDVRRLPLWPPYQVTEPYYPFLASPVEEFTIGTERCEGGGRAYCNGPLRPGRTYYVKLRAFTAPDKFTDTAYTTVYTDVDNTAWIVGASVGGALAVAAAGAALAVRRRRRAACGGGAGGGAAGGAGSAGAGAGARRAGGAAPPRTSRPVRVADFIDHYRLMSADSDFRFSEEFEELKHVGREQPCTAADLPCNRPKNRFTNILPYDHSRYKLQPVDDEEGSDYINANYVPGHNSPREFIVTQGPLHCTRDDFWRMCWESGSRAVVMLTRCVEKGREKCDRYWPYDTRPVYYGDIAVTALNESRYPDWTVTELMVSRGAEQRVLKHFHFTTWPDFGVPEPPTTLARFVRAFRERCPPDSRPVVVHCSAGVGRSGTFITLDRALQQLAAHAECIDVFGMVYAMRRERVWMVQTEQQYICIHQCLVAVLEGQDLHPPHHHQHHHPHNHHLNAAFEDDEGIAESGM